jgi:membrane protein
LFALGKFVIGFYLGNSDVSSAYGAAGSLAIVLIWIYYSSVILLAGAEFTQVLYSNHGKGRRPEPGAMKVEHITVRE